MPRAVRCALSPCIHHLKAREYLSRGPGEACSRANGFPSEDLGPVMRCPWEMPPAPISTTFPTRPAACHGGLLRSHCKGPDTEILTVSSLPDQCRHAVLDQVRRTCVLEAGSEPVHQPDRTIGRPQQHRPRVRGD